MQIGPCVWQIAMILAHESDVVAEWPMCPRLVGRYRGPRRFRVCGRQTRNSVLRHHDRSANPAATASAETIEKAQRVSVLSLHFADSDNFAQFFALCVSGRMHLLFPQTRGHEMQFKLGSFLMARAQSQTGGIAGERHVPRAL